jgi:hypothetical protein
VRGKTAQWLLLRLGLGVLKCLVRLGLRGHHPHPPTPSPASGRGGERIINSVAPASGRGGEVRARGAGLGLAEAGGE